MTNGVGCCPVCREPVPPGTEACPRCAATDRETVAAAGSRAPESGPPRFIGEFEIRRVLGSGGMGTVYEAWQASMHRAVALKVLPPALAFESSGLHRFEREAWIAGRLSHPNIVKVYGQGEAGGVHYIAMELVEGDSLFGEIGKVRESRQARRESESKWRAGHVRRVVELFVGVADALHCVHQHGVVHRDIKPMNLLWDRAGNRLLLTDFGLARDAEASRLTVQGDFMGTVRYMSPEQLLAHRANVDHRSDIWSLGVSLYEALTLDLPYSAPTEEGYVAAVGMKEPTPARKRDAAVPRDLETVLMKCLERDPDRRYQSALELKADLERYLADTPVEARRPGVALKTGRLLLRHRVAAAAVVLALGAAGAAAFWYVRQQAFFASMEAILAKLETQGPDVEGRTPELAPDEQALREAFVSGRLRADKARRLAQWIMNPRILSSDYVERASPNNGIRVAVGSGPYRWGFITVFKRRVNAGSAALAADDGPRYNERLRVPDGALAPLPAGRHRLEFRVSAWMFDQAEHRKAFEKLITDKTGGSIDVGGISDLRRDDVTGTRTVHDGERSIPWEEYWGRMLERTPPKWTGDVAVTKEFQLVDELPENFPLPVGSPSLDAAMSHAITVGNFYLQPNWICYHLSIPNPLPAALAGYLELETEAGQVLARPPSTFRQGAAEAFSTCEEMTSRAPEWQAPEFTMDKDRFGVWVTKNASPRSMWYRIEHGERPTVVARFRASRDVARTVPGLNSYWNGTIEMRGEIRATMHDWRSK